LEKNVQGSELASLSFLAEELSLIDLIEEFKLQEESLGLSLNLLHKLLPILENQFDEIKTQDELVLFHICLSHCTQSDLGIEAN
jgi:hypothetical protein